MNGSNDRFYRGEMAFWLQVKLDAEFFKDEITRQFAIKQYRINRNNLLTVWAIGAVA